MCRKRIIPLQTGWIQASDQVTQRLVLDPTCLPISLLFPIKNKQNFQILPVHGIENLLQDYNLAFKGLKDKAATTSCLCCQVLLQNLCILQCQDAEKDCSTQTRGRLWQKENLAIAVQFWATQYGTRFKQIVLRKMERDYENETGAGQGIWIPCLCSRGKVPNK